MDFASRKLVRRARIRRNHERQVRVAAVKSRKRTLQSSDPLEQPSADQNLLDGFSNSTHSTTLPVTITANAATTVPSLPSLSGSMSLTTSSTSRKISKNGLSLQQTLPLTEAKRTTGTPNPGQVKGDPLLLSGGLRKQGQLRKAVDRGGGGTTRLGDRNFDDTVSDSNLPMEVVRRRREHSYHTYKDKYHQGNGHVSDSAVSATMQQQGIRGTEADSDLLLATQQPRGHRKHGRVRPQGADVKRKRARQLEKLMSYGSKIESVLEEEVSGHDAEMCGNGVELSITGGVDGIAKNNCKLEPLNKKKQTSRGKAADVRQHHPVIADVFPSNPPSPTLSRMVRKKTESLNISENTLQQIKEISSHLRIVNWLWDSNRLPLEAGRKARSCRGTSPSAATTVTTHSDNLVVVRRGSESNWFDWPREIPQEAYRQEQLSPVSINSEFNSDYEDELMSLV